MGNMILGTYTFESNPSELPLIRPKRIISHKKTWGSVAVFDWGAFIVGEEFPFFWDKMPSVQFDEMDELYQAGDELPFDPQDGSDKTYNVKIISLDGSYHLHLESSAGVQRKNVRMTFLILSEVT